jgi:hypothetical protein
MRKHSKAQDRRNRPESGKIARSVQTTLRLPAPLYRRAKSFIEKGASRSVNDFIVRALAAYVHAMERKTIDDAFLPMRDDSEYRRETLKIDEEFTASDAETLPLAERDLVDW